jgi:uncharacterized protein (UPF0216 family)
LMRGYFKIISKRYNWFSLLNKIINLYTYSIDELRSWLPTASQYTRK